MNVSSFILTLCISAFIVSCSQKKDMASKNIKEEEIEVEEIVIQHTADEIEPPQLHIKSKFKTFHDWLANICDAEKPQKPITNYALGIFESQDNFVVSFVGLNKSGKKTSIDFTPSNMYFQLPKTEYKNLNLKQLVNKLTSQFKDFTTTTKFKISFLAEANSITIDGRTIILLK